MLKSAEVRDKEARVFEVSMREFGEAIRSDDKVLAELNNTPDKESFIRLYCQRGIERGFRFTREDVLIAVQEQKTGSKWIIPRNVLSMIAERF